MFTSSSSVHKRRWFAGNVLTHPSGNRRDTQTKLLPTSIARGNPPAAPSHPWRPSPDSGTLFSIGHFHRYHFQVQVDWKRKRMWRKETAHLSSELFAQLGHFCAFRNTRVRVRAWRYVTKNRENNIDRLRMRFPCMTMCLQTGTVTRVARVAVLIRRLLSASPIERGEQEAGLCATETWQRSSRLSSCAGTRNGQSALVLRSQCATSGNAVLLPGTLRYFPERCAQTRRNAVECRCLLWLSV